MEPVSRFALAGGAAVLAGAVNAIAGGGSLLTFPALVAAGLPVVTASVTNTVALCPGYIGATWAQRRQLAGQSPRARLVVPVGILGGAAGALLLLRTGDALFGRVVPFLILLAVALLAAQDFLRARLRSRSGSSAWVALPLLLAGIYGGYFGAGLGVMILAALAVAFDDSLTRLNALKQAVSLAVNLAAAALFVFSGHVDWPLAAAMCAGSLLGGLLGGHLASRIPSRVLRWIIVALGTALAIYYLVRS
ncbi:MAG TPA: sulfite exporter TauE/SafE family protein [Kofleriaceae bacterium]|jgi:hypothetical protein